MKKFSETEGKILDAALAMVSESGSFNLTIRELAKRADVNVAAINYHFKTKDNMLDLVKEYYITNTIDAYSPILDNDLEDIDKLRVFSREIIEYTLKYPGVVNLLKEIYESKDEDEGYKKIVSVTTEMNEELEKALRSTLYTGDELEYQFKRNIFLSSIVYPATHMAVLELDESTMVDDEKKRKYIDYMINLLIK